MIKSFAQPPPEETAPVIVELTRKQIEVLYAVATFLKTGFTDRGFKPFMEWIYDTAPGDYIDPEVEEKDVAHLLDRLERTMRVSYATLEDGGEKSRQVIALEMWIRYWRGRERERADRAERSPKEVDKIVSRLSTDRESSVDESLDGII